VTSPQVSWLFLKAVPAGLALATIISKSIHEERVRRPPDGKTANWPLPRGLRRKWTGVCPDTGCVGVKHIDDHTPLRPGKLAEACNISRSTLWRMCQRGYELLYGDRSTIAHFKDWLATTYADQIRAERAEKRADSAAQLALLD
jgi:hypothetical protein